MIRQIEGYGLRGKKYQPMDLANGTVRSEVIKGFYVRPNWLWQKPRPPVLKVLKELGVKM